MIVDHEVTNAVTDLDQLASMAQRAKDTLATAQLSTRTKIFLYVKILSTFADSQPSLFTTLINKKDMLTGAIYSKFKPRNSQLTP